KDEELKEVLNNFEDYIKTETLAEELKAEGEDNGGESIELDKGLNAMISLEKV
ncbi:MAG: DUF5915 domain-containing protein, partial [Flavobacteriales bacterium]